MNVINRIRFPRTSDASELYLKCGEGASLDIREEYAQIAFTKNGTVSFNSYFNSFYEAFYAKYTKLNSLHYLLNLQGDFRVSVYRELYGINNRQLVFEESFENYQLAEPVKVTLPDALRSEETGRTYLEITCLSEQGLFTRGCIATNEPKLREVSLGIITCTFKKETYLRKTVNTILADNSLKEKQYKIFIVDNGMTLKAEEFEASNVELIPNRNFGGSGGFTRGLIQALQEDCYTHLLLMDDDIDLESESIYRLISLYEYTDQDFAVAGSMLDLYRKNILCDSGSFYGIDPGSEGKYVHNPFITTAPKGGLNLAKTSNVNLLLSEDKVDFGGFWFFSFSANLLKQTKLPLPFFIKVDDVEFGVRIKERLGKSIVAFPGIAVWHEPFYAKAITWTLYYDYRNHLVTHATRNSLSYFDAVKFCTRFVRDKVFVFDYNSAEVMLKGFADYMKGPNFLKEKDPEALHSEIVNLSKTYSIQSVAVDSIADIRTSETLSTAKNRRYSLGDKFIRLFTLNGHLLPDFLLSKTNVLYYITPEHTDWWPKVFRYKRTIVYREGNNSLQQYEMNQLLGISILLKWLYIAASSSLRWSLVSADWRNSFEELTSMEFWKKYLKLDKQGDVQKEVASYASTK
jgi:galactofuranosylgalactofuranosylrhamnosyl-N-acetylglucosaminyl-diphospho-decaprenol beta-1,5/1,6-galactofuranosyltransferase